MSAKNVSLDPPRSCCTAKSPNPISHLSDPQYYQNQGPPQQGGYYGPPQGQYNTGPPQGQYGQQDRFGGGPQGGYGGPQGGYGGPQGGYGGPPQGYGGPRECQVLAFKPSGSTESANNDGFGIVG